jgi:hypothetical protein
MVAASVNQEAINDTAKLIMHRLVARALAKDPTLVEMAKEILAEMSVRYKGRPFLEEWENLLRLPTKQLCSRLIDRCQDMKRLRLSSPFITARGVNFEDQHLRIRVRRAARRIALRISAADARPAD